MENGTVADSLLRDSIIKLFRITLVLDGRVVLRDISWEIMRGESWVIIGPNGAGKTSLLSIINGYRWPSRGSVRVLGQEFGSTDLRELRKRVGMVSSYLGDWLPIDEKVLNVVISGKYGALRLWKDVDGKEREFAESSLRLLGCLPHKNKRIRDLSQGERQKVMIARAMMGRPQLLTLDEPCEGLDLKARESFLVSLSNLAESKVVTVVDVTHRTDEIPVRFTHALLLRAGKMVASGSIREVLTNENLKRCFDVDVEVKRLGGRFYTLVGGTRET